MNEQKRFEQWYTGNTDGNLNKAREGHYVYMPAQIAWNTWQAALASQEPVCDICFGKGYVYAPETSLSDSDGNAPIREQCPECSYTSPQAQPDLQDARRYRWLMKNTDYFDGKYTGWDIDNPDSISEAIDQAMKAKS
jgi:hypothetical protein